MRSLCLFAGDAGGKSDKVIIQTLDVDRKIQVVVGIAGIVPGNRRNSSSIVPQFLRPIASIPPLNRRQIAAKVPLDFALKGAYSTNCCSRKGRSRAQRPVVLAAQTLRLRTISGLYPDVRSTQGSFDCRDKPRRTRTPEYTTSAKKSRFRYLLIIETWHS